jgi:hypothetical protein
MMPQPGTEPAYVFEDREYREWRVQWFADDGDCELAIFAGPKARERALLYAERQYRRAKGRCGPSLFDPVNGVPPPMFGLASSLTRRRAL